MRLLVAAALGLAMSSAASAQDAGQQVNFLSKVLQSLQLQRNEANDRVVNAEARAALLADEIAALRKRIDELSAPKAPAPGPEK